MTNPMIETAARALANAPGEDGRCALYYYKNLAQAAITAIEPMIRAQAEREIVEWLRGLCMHLSDVYADAIEAGEYRK